MSKEWKRMGYVSLTSRQDCLLIAIGKPNEKKRYGIVDLKDLEHILKKSAKFTGIVEKVETTD